jgi:hypothetical protein
MSSQQSPRTSERLAKHTRFASQPQVHQYVAETPSPPPSTSASDSQNPSPASEQDDHTAEADETIDHSQRPGSPVHNAQQSRQASLPTSSRSLVSEQATLSIAQEAWWISLQQEQLVAYTKHQQELAEQVRIATANLLNYNASDQNYDQIVTTMRLLTQREYEIRTMLENRQAWELFVRMYERRSVQLSARAPPHP